MQSKLKSLLNIFDGVLGLYGLQVSRDLQMSMTTMAAKTSLKKQIRVFSIFIAIIPIHLLFHIQSNGPWKLNC